MPRPNLKTDQSGFVLVAAVMILLIVVMIGIFATDTTIFETKIAGYDKAEKVVFYDQETCLADTKLDPSWLTVAFITADSNSKQASDKDEVTSLSKVVAGFEVRHLTETPTPIDGLSNEANNIPYVKYINSPPTGSGFSPRDFEVRNFAVTCMPPQAQTTKVILQEGTYKVFNKFEE